MKKISILDVVAKSGLSLATVSKVLNNSPTVRESNRQKVLQAIKELDYRPNPAARSLARGATRLIGLTLPGLNDTFYDNIVQSVNRHLEENGYVLALSVFSQVQAAESDANSSFLFQEDRVDGVIVISPLDENPYLLELKRKRIPYVVVDNQVDPLNALTVNVDNYAGGYEATKHLLDLGHTRISYVGGSERYLSARERRRGFESAMRDAGLTPVAVTNTEFNIRSGFDAAKAWIRSDKVPTAVFAGEDGLALGVTQAFQDEGYRVPDEVSIVGFDDQTFSQYIHPRLTTIRQPMEQIGEHAVRLLLQMIQGTAKRQSSVMLKPELIVRESTSSYNKR
ncbi:LacI family transcriptional regulator [Paenibacillus sp. H1-7]|uniref:LacI family DNA-binding transcriptional regulator n=1 Tax=Paenibacillus sp. H1-7 TaxID=2282849 RepID=UPI001EF889A0|nr:LacI family DNA-binding transcriptional regulator [Paenibacillus sp. H1-7]ULL17516.1 LacI family transcriptional regulator [Paenibacillus sp. H1-7]